MVVRMKSAITKLDNAIDSYSEKKKAKAIKERKAERKKAQEYRKFIETEHGLNPEKIKLYKEIVKWKNDFVKSKQFKKLLKTYFVNGEHEIIIFWSDWGHNKPDYPGGDWSRLYVTNKRKLRYFAGYKWMPSGPDNYLSDDFIWAKRFMHKYWKELHQHIKSGEVYETIKDELKEDD